MPRLLYLCENINFIVPNANIKLEKVEVMLPGCESLPDVIQDISPDLDSYYLVKRLPVVELVKEEFVKEILRKGHFTGISVGTRVDNHTVVAVLPSGHLILSVDKDLYQELGLSGKPSKYTGRNATRFVVEIDLFNANHSNGKKQYNRVLWSLKDRLNLTFNFIFSWEPINEEKVNFMQLTRLWDKYVLEDLSIVSHTIQKTQTTVVPKLSHNQSLVSTPGDGQDVSSIYEYIGTISCDANQVGGPGIYSSSYTCPEPCEEVKGITCQRWSGLISSEKIKQLLKALRSFVKSDAFVPWAALTVHGFDDSPVSWWRKEHGFHKNGCNLYTILILPDDTYWLYMAIGTNDECP
ncbi:ribonuclease P protein subunit p40-like isoform X2 [Apostichopus japonicus]|uniref:ribonuclease P protein subunit p40-like isoform X2 n=1 Tax=Stichopus japonicus TaxID=307972 RepID=UPI003AB6A731